MFLFFLLMILETWWKKILFLYLTSDLSSSVLNLWCLLCYGTQTTKCIAHQGKLACLLMECSTASFSIHRFLLLVSRLLGIYVVDWMALPICSNWRSHHLWACVAWLKCIPISNQCPWICHRLLAKSPTVMWWMSRSFCWHQYLNEENYCCPWPGVKSQPERWLSMIDSTCLDLHAFA